MKFSNVRKVVAILLLFALLFSAFPMSAVANNGEESEGSITAEDTVAIEAVQESTEGCTESSTENCIETETEETIISEEVIVTEASTEANEPSIDSEQAENDADGKDMSKPTGLFQYVNGVYVPYTHNDEEGSTTKAPPASSITYKDIFGAHSSDFVSGYNYIKAGGAYTAKTYGANDTAWFPLSTYDGSKELSYDGSHYVCTGYMFANHGPVSYACNDVAGWNEYIALPIRPSQEDGADYSVYPANFTNYSTDAGVPSYKLEILKSKQIPEYTQSEFTTINLICAVTNNLGGMTYSGDGDYTAAAYTLIMNVICGYIGIGSDHVFHGLPFATSDTAVNKKMCEILVRCEVYSKENGMTGNATGDATLTRLKNYLGYNPANMDGYCVMSGTASYTNQWYLQVNKSQSSGNQIYIWAANEIEVGPGKPVKLQKSASGSINDCITNNPLYSLQGAAYLIYTEKDSQGNPKNAITVYTGADGSVTTEEKYGVGTTVYAKEKTPPAGYQLNDREYSLEVSANESENVFNVTDPPVFDPQVLKLTKTGDSEQKIGGAVFKVEYYASSKATGEVIRTWYFQSKDTGVIEFKDSYLAAGYQSDTLYKPTGSTVQFPLGCIKVTEVKAASGYILPKGDQGVAYIYIRQNTVGGDATAYWGDKNGNPVSTLGMYTITNDAVTAVNEEAYGAPFEVVKTDESNVPLQGAVFKVVYYNSSWCDPNAIEKTWYFKTDSNGYFTLDATHRLDNSEYHSDTLFATGKIPLGIMAVTEVKAPTGFVKADFTGVWRMMLSADNTEVKCFWAASNGYDPTTSYGDVAYILDTDPDKLYVKNTTIPGTATMKKALPTGVNGNLEGYCFNLYRSESATLWYGRSDANGNIYKTNASHSEVAETNRVYTFTGLKDGTYSFRELLNGKNAKTTKVRIYTSGGITASFNHTYTGSELGFDTNGDCVIGNIHLTGLNGGGNLTIEIENTPLPGTMTMRKALTAGSWGSKEGYFFNVHRAADSAGSANTWFGRSDNNGNIYSTDQYHNEVSASNRVYTFEGMTDGNYSIRELMNGKDARTEKIRIYTSGGETAAFDHTYTGSDLSFENNGDCVLSNIPITGLNGGGTLTIEITNTPIYGKPFELIKVDASDTSVTLEGAIFKVELYDEDMLSDDDDDPEYTWYFATDEHGYFMPTEHYLADPSTGYVSDQMLQNDGDFPLGYMVVTEVKAPEGFKKSDVIGYWCMVRSTTNPYKSDCYWANPDGTHATLGYGELAFILPQDDPDALYVKDAPYVKLNIFKTSPNGTVKDIEFRVEKQVGTTWQNIKVDGGYFKTNAAGQIIVDDSQVIGELEVGQVLRITENVPEGTICTSENPQIITLAAGDNNTVTFENVEISLKIYKTATNNKVKDIDFEVSKYVNNQWVLLGTYTTNASGQIEIETEHLAVGAQFRIKEIVPVGTYCTGKNPKTITLTMGSNYVTFTNKPIKVEIVKTSTDGKVNDIDFVVDIKNDANEWENIGTFTTGTDGKIDIPQQYLIQGATYQITEIVPENYICTTQNPKIVTLNQATTTVNFSNKPFSGLEIIKTSPDGNVENIEFVIEKQTSVGIYTGWEVLDPKNPSYFTDGKGKIIIDNDAVLETGMVLRITENVPENYICISENPKMITLAIGKNSVTFENIPVAKLSLVKRSDDGKVDGIQFKLEKKQMTGTTGPTQRERWDLIGTYTTHDGGIILPEEFGALDYDGIYRVTEIVPQGYICENPVQTFTAGIDSEGNPVTEHQVTFENRRIYGNLEITKVDESYPDHKLTGAEFTVIMSKFGSEDLETAIMSEVLDEQGNGTGVYRLEHIEYGTTCEIRETAAPEGYELSDEVWRVTIEEEKTYTITTPNFDAVINRQVEGQISVHKEDSEHNAMSGVQFLLEYSVDEGKNWAPVQARTAENPILPGYCTSEGLTDGILTTGADGNIVFTGLALSTEINSNVTYRLTEVKTQNGNTLMGISVFEGPLTIEEPELSYKVVNESVFTMPRTGSNGFVGTGIAIGLAILAALIILLNLPRGKKNKKEII